MILDGFPELWFDELLYHGLARYQDRIHIPFFRDFMYLLFGETNMVATINFSSALSYLARSIPSVYGYTGEYLIKYHTLAPYYKLFFTGQRYAAFCDAMLNKSSKRPHFYLKTNTNIIWIKYCSACIRDDTNQYGEPYFHRSHQIPYITVCWKHATFLTNSNLPASSRTEFVSAKRAKLDLSISYIDQENTEHTFLWQIAKDSNWLLNQDKYDLSRGDLTEKYQFALDEKNLLTPNGTL